MLRVNVYDWNTWNGGWELLGYWFRDSTCGHWHYHSARPISNLYGRFEREFIRHRPYNFHIQASQSDATTNHALLKFLKDNNG